MPRLLLINPASSHKVLGNIRATALLPLNLPYLAAVTPSHYQIDVLDENIEPFVYREADIVGITVLTMSVLRAYEISQIYRDKGIPTVLGGIHVSMMPEEAMRYCDTVVVGEAETIWPTILEDFENGCLKKQYEGIWASLDTLPTPRRDILKNQYYGWGTIQTSRGCPMNCTFCSVTAFNGRRFRRRPLEAVIEELESIPQKKIFIVDDNIIGYGEKDLEWARAFFRRIIEKKIKKTFFAQTSILFGEDTELIQLAAKAGVRIVLIGMESINPETLSAFGKKINLERLHQTRYPELISRIRKAGIVLQGTFVLGGDEDDRSVFQSTLEFIKKGHIDVLQMTKPTPLPGTQLWHTLKRDGRIIDQNFPDAWNDYSFSRLVFTPKKMSREEVYRGFTYLRSIYYSVWETLKRTFFTLMATKSPTSAFIAYKLNASYRKAFKQSDHYQQYHGEDLKSIFEP